MKKIIVDREKCIGCGACAMLAPKTFSIDKKGKSKIFNQQGDTEEDIDSAINCCPVQAISSDK